MELSLFRLLGLSREKIPSMKFLINMPLLLFAIKMAAQPTNLVLNPSFEALDPGKEYPACSFGTSNTAFNIAMADWGTFLDCTPDLVVWKPNAAGECFFPKPRTGEKAVGLITYLPGIDMARSFDFHEFIQGKLSLPLVPGKEYTFECYVQQGNAAGERHIRNLYHIVKNLEVIPLAAGSLGVYFSVNEEKNMTLDVAFPQLVWYEPIITKQGEWLRLSRTFKADRAYQYFTIGNFSLDINTATNLENNAEIEEFNTVTLNYQKKKRRIGYYLFDDFWIGEGSAPPPMTIAEDLKKNNAYTFKNVNFETGKWDLQPEALPELEGLLAFLKNNVDLKVEIGGHTDNIGNEEANRALSAKRAEAVANHLISNGISSNRVSAKGYGEGKPIASNDTENGRLKNRRVACKIK